MFLDHQDALWIGTGSGLDKMDKQNGQFTHYELKTSEGNLTSKTIFCIREDKDHILWVGTDEGLFRFDISNGKVNAVRIRAVVISICVDSKNNVWVGSDTAGRRMQYLYRFDRNNKRIVLYRSGIRTTHQGCA